MWPTAAHSDSKRFSLRVADRFGGCEHEPWTLIDEETDMEWLEVATPWLLPIVSALATSLIAYYLQRRKYIGEVDDLFVGAASKVVKLYDDAFTELEARVRSLEKENENLRQQMEDVEAEHQRMHAEDRRRMKLLARVALAILEVCNGDGAGIEDFIVGIKASCDDLAFLREIIDEVV